MSSIRKFTNDTVNHAVWFISLFFITAFLLHGRSTARARATMPTEEMGMPLVAPLLLQDGKATNVLTLLHDLEEPLEVDVEIDTLSGLQVGKFTETIPAHVSRSIDMADKVATLGLPAQIVGSLIVTPHVSRVTVGAQLSIRSKQDPGQELQEELQMLDQKAPNRFRAVAVSVIGTPIIALRNLDNHSQDVSVTCITEHQAPQTRHITILPLRTEIRRACGMGIATDIQETGQLFEASHERSLGSTLGISIESRAAPGSLAVYGISRASGGAPQSIKFIQSGSFHSSSFVFNGVPVGETTPLSSLSFVPTVGLTNFNASAVKVTISYVSSGAEGTQLHVVASQNVPGLSSARVTLLGLAADRTFQNSFLVSFDSEPGEVVASLVAEVLNAASLWVESTPEDFAKSTNGGEHPWRLNNDLNSFLLLYNADALPKTVGVQVYSDNDHLARSRTLLLDGHQTLSLNLRSVLIDAGSARPPESGLVQWANLEDDHVFGKVLQVDRSTLLLTRSFACQNQTIICGAEVNPSTLRGVAVGQTTTATGYALTCSSVGQCTCNGSAACSFQTQSPPNPAWTIANTSIASISGASNQTSVTIRGNALGSTLLNLSTGSSGACGSSTSPAGTYKIPGTVNVIQIPTGTRVVSDTQNKAIQTSQAPCNAGQAGWIRNTVEIMTDQNGKDIAAGGQNLTETVSISPTNNGLGISGTYTGSTSTNSNGTFVDSFYACSAQCPASTLTSSGTQSINDSYSGGSFTINNSLVYGCSYILFNGSAQ